MNANKRISIINDAYRQLDRLKHFNSNDLRASKCAFISYQELEWSIKQMEGEK